MTSEERAYAMAVMANKGMTLRAIGKHFGVSYGRVSQIIAGRAIQLWRLRNHAEEETVIWKGVFNSQTLNCARYVAGVPQ